MNLDPRLLPLIDTLSTCGLSWLAFDMLNELRQGEEPLEVEAVLAEARHYAMKADNFLRISDAEFSPQFIEGIEQLKWATKFIRDKLGGVIEELATCFENLEEIGRDNDLIEFEHASSPFRISLRDGDNRYDVLAEELHTATENVQKLDLLLDTWLLSVSNGKTEQ